MRWILYLRLTFKKYYISGQPRWLKPIILATGRQRSEIGGLKFKANPGKKLVRPHLNQWQDVMACVCHSCWEVGAWGSTSRRIMVEASPSIKRDLISNIINAKRAAECDSSVRAPA
jgi:hypothetical protein